MYSRCAPCSRSSAPCCWAHSEIRRPETESGTGERTLPGVLFDQSRRSDAGRAARIVIENRPEPPLRFLHGPAFTLGVIFGLVALDLADAEIGALRMAEIEPGYRRARPHHKALGQGHADALDIEQAEQRALLGVIGLRGIAGRRADAVITLGDQIGVR